MAFQPPTAERRPQITSIQTHSSQDHYHESPASPALSRHIHEAPALPEEQEWIVFSPSVTVEPSNFSATEVGTNDGHMERSELWTEGTGSRLSGTQHYGEETEEEEEEEEVEEEEEDEDEADQSAYHQYNDDDDDSLGPFREHQRGHQILLPTHDGRGLFPSVTSQEEEASVFMPGVASLEESLRVLSGQHKMFDQGEDMHSRIQKWREEHSTAFMEEIVMARSNKSKAGRRGPKALSEQQRREEMEASMMLDEDEHASKPAAVGKEGGEFEADREVVEVPETFWRRVTRSLMRDIMGIDDTVLEVIFGESLPPSAASTSPDTDINNDAVGVKWERSLLERIARELGTLIQQYTIHPTQGAFSTYSRWSEAQIRVSGHDMEAEGAKTPRPQATQNAASQKPPAASTAAPSEVEFTPTLSHVRPDSRHNRARTHFVDGSDDDRGRMAVEARMEAQMRKEYWEQELGVRVFFSYLKSRFSSAPTPPSAASRPVRKASSADSHKPIYHQHPLIQRRGQQRGGASVSPHSGQSPMTASWCLLGLGGYRNGSSCASQSTRPSKRATKGKGTQGGGAGGAGPASTTAGTTVGKGCYWEVETSVGSAGGGSCVGMGSWGEI